MPCPWMSFNCCSLFTGTYRVSEKESPSCSSANRRKQRWWWWGTGWRKWSSGASQSFPPGGVLGEEGEWGVSQGKERRKGVRAAASVNLLFHAFLLLWRSSWMIAKLLQVWYHIWVQCPAWSVVAGPVLNTIYIFIFSIKNL